MIGVFEIKRIPLNLALLKKILLQIMAAKTEINPQAAATTILDVNDDCLREIFEKLNDSDLITVANVCSNFRWNAQHVFSLRYAQKYFCFCIDEAEFLTQRPHPTQLHLLYSTLRNFGPLINSLQIELNFGYPDSGISQKIMKLIVQHCSETLNEMRLLAITFNANVIPVLRPLLKRLKSLDFFCCHFDTESNASKIFFLCSQLKTLSITNITNTSRLSLNLPIRFANPTLKSFKIEHCGKFTNKTIKKFLKKNPQLEKLEMEWCRGIPSRIFKSVVQYTPRIEKLTLANNDDDGAFVESANHLKELTALKWLEIDCHYEPFAPVIDHLAEANVPLECLRLLAFVEDQELFEGISKFKHLKTLKLFYGRNMNISDVLGMVRRLSNLCDLRVNDVAVTANDYLEVVRSATKLQHLQLELIHKVTLDVELYTKMLEVVATRKEKSRLKIGFMRSSVTVPQETLVANLHLLEVDEKCIIYVTRYFGRKIDEPH